MTRMFTAEEVSAAVVDGNMAMVKKIEELCARTARAEYQLSQLYELAEEVRRSGDTRLASMAIATLARVASAGGA